MSLTTMFSTSRALFLLNVYVCIASAAKGLDTSEAVSKSVFECLKKDGYSFYIARVGHSTGIVDTTGIQNIKNARAAGFSDVGGYIYPCLKSSCPSASTQVANSIEAMKKAGQKVNLVNYLWMDVEGTWPSNLAENRKFIQDMVNEATKLGVTPGIYTAHYIWPHVVGEEWTGMSHLPLWWPNYDKTPGFGNFKSFGGWTKPFIHQYSGTSNPACGVSADPNYKP